MVVVGLQAHSVPSLEKARQCHDEEKATLFQFKHSLLSINQCDCPWVDDPKPKLESWKEGGDCCSWEGVECDHHHVVGLDLSGSCLLGSINSSSSLFTLTHLQRLDLSYNDFNSSHIPSAVGNLSRLTHLNLTSSNFYGQIPIQHLSNIATIVSLDLSFNPDLELCSLKGLVQHMSNLKHLHLSHVNLSSSAPPHDFLSNLASLESLDLSSCELRGGFLAAIFNLPNLKMLDLSRNDDLRGYLPNFCSGSPLKSLRLYHTSFGGVLPLSIGNLASLEELDIGGCNFTGDLPMSLGNLTQLVSLDISGANHFTPDTLNTSSLSWIGNLINLTYLYLDNMDLTGKLPSKFINTSKPMRALNTSHMTNYMELDLHPTYRWSGEDYGIFDYSVILHNKGLEMNYMKIPNILCTIDFSSNNFEGEISGVYGDLTGLQALNLSRNHLIGNIPSSFSSMKNLESLDLSLNHLSGQIPMELTKLTFLSSFEVSFNNLSGPIPQGNQFCSYDPKSYEGNPGLSFETWNKQCGNARSLPQLQQAPSPTEDDDDEDDSKIKWMIISIGFASGLAVGMILGNELTTRKHYWFVKTFARKQRGYA
ncbi:unnamed protein product [Cuscuta campestris]|uniref:Leucine-rich repeat-containing N-terminal plant-type domain-containing protein n=1 Tax=Cuscuta campestris TaxID=132261 RepID=A0A484LAV5_9ASTE|nr:unnamed protein product [Cuscuta campestris]